MEIYNLKNCNYGLENNKGRAPLASPTGFYGLSKDGKVEIHFYLSADGKINSFFPVKNKIMIYRFEKDKIKYPDNTIRKYPGVIIENSELYGVFFNSEITHIGENLDYVKEIVSKLEAVLDDEIDLYEGFGYEIYMIECDKEKAIVKNIFEDDKIDAIIPTIEVYEPMRDWRDYLIEYYTNE